MATPSVGSILGTVYQHQHYYHYNQAPRSHQCDIADAYIDYRYLSIFVSVNAPI